MSIVKIMIVSWLFIIALIHAPLPVLAITNTVMPTPTIIEQDQMTKVDYMLPYPGILPDHPLYIFKRMRDFILDKLIVDPIRKAEFYIMQADKRLNMGVSLAKKGNAILSEEVVSKGEKYMELGLSRLEDAKRSGREVPGYMFDKLERALAKHVEVLEGLIAQAGEAQKAGLTQSLQLIQKLQGEIEKLR